MFRSVYRASRRFALAFTLVSSGTLAGAVSATDGLPRDVAEAFYSSDYDTAEAANIELASFDPANCSTGGVLERAALFGSQRGLGNDSSCAPPWWAHRDGAFGEFLYLTAGSSDIIYAVEGTAPDPAVGSPTGPLGIVQMSLESGYRTGFSLALNDCSSVNVAYANWGGRSDDSIRATGANVLLPPLQYPTIANAGFDSLGATATQRIDFQTLDLNYRQIWKKSDCMAVNWLAGVRYGKLEQTMNSRQLDGVANGLATVDTEINFEGFGITGGLDLERYSCHTGLFLYGKGMASLLAGDWRANYRQKNQFGGFEEAANRYEDFRATPILEAELGVGWRSETGRIRMQSGFMMAGWYESVSNRSYIDAVTHRQLVDIGETITFSGLTSRVTFSF